jgi:3'(2'), 5'-bisphosphate nucleotidase
LLGGFLCYLIYMYYEETTLNKIVAIARSASDIILKYYSNLPETMNKQDGSPVTIADQESEQLIEAGLRKLTPDIPVVGEELVADGRVPDIAGGQYWCVDPIDGTSGFLKHNDMFCICIALIKDNYPVFGLIHSPTQNATWLGSKHGAYKLAGGENIPLSVQLVGQDKIAITSPTPSKKMIRFLSNYQITEHRYQGSALKFCLLAENKAHFYPRLSPSSEWDTAAGQAILEAAGGHMYDMQGKRFSYQGNNFKNESFIASNDANTFAPS